ncbi:uncharacterized protein LOC134748802 [Cydia strobilella]|uniref:uncharacterized protein LOC134748802 n=1 Tax=Cydia strobilella TaxID=1100964 RepID=UPI003007D5DC
MFFMFQSGLICTMLLICRYLSPSLKNFNITLSDLYVYSCLNIRPVYLSKMCELFTNQKNKTLLLLLNILVYGELGKKDGYYNQIQTMVNLVQTRKMELSTNVFTANLQTILNFFGRLVSYIVLMIQYFYMHVFSE